MKHSRHLVPSSFCPSNLLLWVSGLARSANTTPRADMLFSCETSHSWWAWVGALRIPPSALKTDSICVIFGIFCSLWARETSPHKHKRRKSPPMETSRTTKATSYIICLFGQHLRCKSPVSLGSWTRTCWSLHFGTLLQKPARSEGRTKTGISCRHSRLSVVPWTLRTAQLLAKHSNYLAHTGRDESSIITF